jgi:hypothetical protein
MVVNCYERFPFSYCHPVYDRHEWLANLAKTVQTRDGRD